MSKGDTARKFRNDRGLNHNSLDYALEKIEKLEVGEFDCLRAYSTAGDLMPPYHYQWIAYMKTRPGDDDPYEGSGGSPLEAIRDLYEVLIQSLRDEEEVEQ